MSNQFNQCFQLFSKTSQDIFLKWTLDDLLARHGDAVKQAKLGPPEVKLMFERNDPSLMKTFWKHFYMNSGALEIYRFGYFNPGPVNGKFGTVHVNLKYPDGRSGSVDLTMLKEGALWKFGYLESGLRGFESYYQAS